MKIAYFDCFCGAAGDMITGALLDAGLDKNFLLERIESLNLSNYEIKIEKVVKKGVSATSFKPIVGHQHHHRGLSDIKKIIEGASLSEKARSDALEVFQIIGRAEAGVHNKSIEEIHFHEVGAVDSIIDIVSVCAGLDALGIDKIYSSTVSVGGGTVKAAHGIMPVPAPATAEIIEQAGIPVCGGPVEMELFTPTAAAVFAHFVDEYRPLPEMKIDAIGYGAGSYEHESVPNVFRLTAGQTAKSDTSETDNVYLLETNIDDSTGEKVAFVVGKLLDLGVLDVWMEPIYMKYGRPAIKLCILAGAEMIKTAEEAIFEEGLTFGVRRRLLERSKLARIITEVDTSFGLIKVKAGTYGGREVVVKPEYRDCARAAKANNVGITSVVYEAVQKYKEKQT